MHSQRTKADSYLITIDISSTFDEFLLELKLLEKVLNAENLKKNEKPIENRDLGWKKYLIGS